MKPNGKGRDVYLPHVDGRTKEKVNIDRLRPPSAVLITDISICKIYSLHSKDPPNNLTQS